MSDEQGSVVSQQDADSTYSPNVQRPSAQLAGAKRAVSPEGRAAVGMLEAKLAKRRRENEEAKLQMLRTQLQGEDEIAATIGPCGPMEGGVYR